MKKHFLPIYMQIFEELKKNILCHHWAPGELLPTELELADQYQVARPTLRKALGLLEKDGYIIRKKFSGTVVAPESAHRQYLKLDVGFFTRMDLNNPEAYIYMFQENLQLGNVLRYGVKQNYFVRFFPWPYPAEERPYYNLEEVLFRKGVDGFVVNSPMYLTDVLDVMRKNRVPHVALESNYDKPGVNTVMFDDEISMKEEFELLYQLGHRRIGFIGAGIKRPEFNSQTRRFYHLFLKLSEQYGLELPPHFIQISGADQWRNEISIEEIKTLTRNMFARSESRPTALIFPVGKYAKIVIDTLEVLGLQVPRDVSVISPLIWQSYSPDFTLSGHYSDMESLSERVFQELGAWVRNPAYRPACHRILKNFQRGKTIAPPKKSN